MLRGAAGGKCNPFGPQGSSRRLPGALELWPTCQHPGAGPAIPFRGHLTAGPRDVQPESASPRPRSGRLCAHPAPAQPSRAAPSRLPSRTERRRPAPASSPAGLGPPPSRLAPPLSLAKSLKAPAPSVTPGASNHSVSISLTLFIPLKTHLKTLQPGVCSGLYPH